MDVVEYEIKGAEMQYVEVELDPGEAAVGAPHPGKILPMDLSQLGAGFFGGERLFFARLSGPGTIWLQSLPFSRLASRVFAAAPQAGGRKEVSALGGLAVGGGLLGGLLGGGDE